MIQAIPQETTCDVSVPALRQRECSIEGLANAKLRNCSYYPVRCVECHVRGHVLTLEGHVPSYFLKQVAQTVLLRELEEAVVIDNRLEVAYDQAG